MDVKVLLTVNAMATCRDGTVLNASAMSFNTPKNGKISMTPITLKADTDQATRRDKGESLMLINNAVEVVPILAPITMGMAESMSMTP